MISAGNNDRNYKKIRLGRQLIFRIIRNELTEQKLSLAVIQITGLAKLNFHYS